MKTNQWLTVILVACAAWGGGTFSSLAQAAGGGANPGGMGGVNFDPTQIQQQFQQRLLDAYRDSLVVTNDDEWTIISERIQKVLDARQDSGFGGLGGIVGMLGNRGAAGRRGMGALGGLLNPQSPEEDALREAVNSNASSADLKAALAKVQEARKAKQSKIDQAQSDLRKVLSLRREAIATIIGLL